MFLFLANFRNLANVIPENEKKHQKFVIFRIFCVFNTHLSLELWVLFGDGMWIQPSENPDQGSAFAKKAVLMYLEEYLLAKKYMKHGPVFEDFEGLEFFLSTLYVI